jgi:hypothetical protein
MAKLSLIGDTVITFHFLKQDYEPFRFFCAKHAPMKQAFTKI